MDLTCRHGALSFNDEMIPLLAGNNGPAARRVSMDGQVKVKETGKSNRNVDGDTSLGGVTTILLTEIH